MSDAIVGADEQDNRDRLRAFDAAVEHRAAMRSLATDLKLAATINEAERLVAEMRRVGDEYEAWLRADTVRMQSRNDERVARSSTAGAFA